MLIKNITELLPSDLNLKELNLRKIALNCLEIAINAVKPENLIRNSVKIQEDRLTIQEYVFDLKQYHKIYLIGGGKASAKMATSLENILISYGKIQYEGFLNIPDGLEISKSNFTEKIKLNYASHPIPNENGLKGTKEMMQIIEKTSKDDLIFCLISGGGSALLPLPKKNITLEVLQKVNSILLASGASIHEMNTVRKHLSDFKGGNLAKKVHELSGATLISLIISDVVGDHLDSIASGPTVPDSTTFRDALNILKKYEIWEEIPISVKRIIKEGVDKKISENPKINDNCFRNVHNFLIGSVKSAVIDIISYINEQNFYVDYFSNEIVGEARDFGKSLIKIVRKKHEDILKKMRIALIGTGELTVTIKGKGIGGRNQEMLLSSLNNIRKNIIEHPFLILGANLDGIEGNSNAMGAIIDNFVLSKTIEEGIDIFDYLENNDSNSFFKKVKSEIITGSTGCNVNDILLILLLPSED